ncbi:hypothetical protein DdX_07318 [Ditylenchus destructor]|uniref:Uncharacterized protein n=1 Tax=Ditylenchus destructor TaxID=166010 RepID=A0AAD4N602_9BILA|nr:hypothetical protein DdX_07318 [Ditylenchus destructor]
MPGRPPRQGKSERGTKRPAFYLLAPHKHSSIGDYRRIPIPIEHCWGVVVDRKAFLAVLVPSKRSALLTLSDTISVGEIPGNIQSKSLLGQKQAGTGELHSQGPGRGWRLIAAVKGNIPKNSRIGIQITCGLRTQRLSCLSVATAALPFLQIMTILRSTLSVMLIAD